MGTSDAIPLFIQKDVTSQNEVVQEQGVEAFIEFANTNSTEVILLLSTNDAPQVYRTVPQGGKHM